MADFNAIAAKWQKRWEYSKTFEVKEDSLIINLVVPF